jgi:hypothetical protein
VAAPTSLADSPPASSHRARSRRAELPSKAAHEHELVHRGLACDLSQREVLAGVRRQELARVVHAAGHGSFVPQQRR